MKFYVYAHFRPDTGKLFYIGKGKGRRAWDRSSRNRHWKHIVARHGRNVRIIRDGLAEQEALDIEARLIAHRTGLATYTSGGGGISGFRHSDQTKRKMSERMTGKALSDQARQRMSATIRSRPDLLALRSAAFTNNNPAKREENRARSSERMRTQNPMLSAEVRAKAGAHHKGKPLLAETKAKISAALKGRKRGPMKPNVAAALATANAARKRPVQTACGLVFDSTLGAAKATGASQGNIVNNCAGRANTAGGYTWSYVGGNGK